MAVLTLDAIRQQVDLLLELVCIELQITDTQWENANRSYESVSTWLDKPGTSLSPYRPLIYAQGSMALGTTVKPRKREGFDADAVCLLHAPRSFGPMRIYEMVHDRLKESDVYGPKIERLDRCIRLNFADPFHMDVIAAVPAPQDGLDAIVIPDRENRWEWAKTNPKGFVRWFGEQATQYTSERGWIQLSAEPLPQNDEPGSKTTLQRAAQLYKRRREVAFNGDDDAPKSILLTTLCGMFYNKEPLVADALTTILGTIAHQASIRRDIPTVPNPTNADENFARHWQDKPSLYRTFLEFSGEFQVKLQRLNIETNLYRRAELLKELFDPTGTGVVERAVKEYTNRVQDGRTSNTIRMKTGTVGALTTAASPSIGIPGNSFFGD